MLSREDHRVHSANRGSAALSRLIQRLREVLVALVLTRSRRCRAVAGSAPDVGPTPGRLLRGADSGKGLSDEVRRRALEPFFTTKGPRHQGLGLSLAYGIIRRHRGELEIPRDEGQGGVVTFHLPPHRHNGGRP